MSAFMYLPVCAAGSPAICAIRWDAWYSNGASDPGRYTSNTLSPAQWHSLAPINAKFDPQGKITWTDSPESFDAEIRAAHQAKLCWTYVMYGKDNVIDLTDPMMRGLTLHRASAIRSYVNYALMTTSSEIGRTDHYRQAVGATVELLGDTNYQRVLIRRVSRPLLFLLFNPTDVMGLFSGSLAKMREAIDAIRRSAVEHDLGNPYLVVVFSPASAAESLRIALGGDAISEYIAGYRKGGAQAWSNFEPSIEADWDAYAAAGTADAIPTLRTGADIRARCQTPPPFDHRFESRDCGTYTINPTIEELQTEFRHAFHWIAKRASRDPSSLLLVYSWSECDESGNCLMPTVGDPTGRKLQAISIILNPSKH